MSHSFIQWHLKDRPHKLPFASSPFLGGRKVSECISWINKHPSPQGQTHTLAVRHGALLLVVIEMQDPKQRGTWHTKSEPRYTHVGILLACWKRSITFLFRRTNTHKQYKKQNTHRGRKQVLNLLEKPLLKPRQALCFLKSHSPRFGTAPMPYSHRCNVRQLTSLNVWNTAWNIRSVTGDKFKIFRKVLVTSLFQRNQHKESMLNNRTSVTELWFLWLSLDDSHTRTRHPASSQPWRTTRQRGPAHCPSMPTGPAPSRIARGHFWCLQHTWQTPAESVKRSWC